MLRLPLFPILVAAILAPVIACGCSSGGMNPATPDDEQLSPIPKTGGTSNRVLWGMWEIHYDLGQMMFDVTPLRNVQPHFNITNMLLPPNCEDCIKIKFGYFNPEKSIQHINVTLRNPTQLTAYDVRGILFTNEAGHELVNAEYWTDLYDIPGGQEINPFIAFAKWSLGGDRAFGPDEVYAEKFKVFIPTPPQWGSVKFAVDASWPGNCHEPYGFENFWHGQLYASVGSKTEIKIDVLDWQNDVDAVFLTAPEIAGEEPIELTQSGLNTWSAELTNNNGAPAGFYDVQIKATSAGSGSLALYGYREVVIHEPGDPINPVDVTPPWLNFAPREVFIEGNYAYVAATVNGLHIFDISDRLNPVWVNRVETPGEASDVVVKDGYAYVAGYRNCLYVIDVDPPESAHLVNLIERYLSCYRVVAVEDDYAFVVGGEQGLDIIDINPPESAQIINSIEIDGYTDAIAIDKGYAYVVGQKVSSPDSFILVFDIDPPESAHIIISADIPDCDTKDIVVEDGYAYITGNLGLIILDIDPIGSAHFVNLLEELWYSLCLTVGNGYAYVTTRCCEPGFVFVDIDPPESAYIVNNIDIQGDTRGVALTGDYAYVADENNGLQIVDIDPIESTYIAASVDTLNCYQLNVEDQYAYAPRYDHIRIVDISTPESAYITNTIEMPEGISYRAIYGEYLYGADDTTFYIMKIEPPDSIEVINSVGGFSQVGEVTVNNDYAYVEDDTGLTIVGINPPESAWIVSTIEMAKEGVSPAAGGGYVCDMVWIDHTVSKLRIFDVEPPEDAYFANWFKINPAIGCIDVEGGFAYVGCYNVFTAVSCLKIALIDPPETAAVIKSIEMPLPWGAPRDLEFHSGYVYMADGENGLEIIDVDPVDSAHFYSSLDTPGDAYNVCLSGNYAYVADGDGGLRIIKLW